jgi:hypothetical protein
MKKRKGRGTFHGIHDLAKAGSSLWAICKESVLVHVEPMQRRERAAVLFMVLIDTDCNVGIAPTYATARHA